MANFLHDLHNNANNTSTENIRDMVIALGTGNELFLVTIVSSNRVRLYTSFTKWKDGLTGNNPALQNKFFAVKGKLIQDRGHIVHLDANTFNLRGANTTIPIAAAITTALKADPAIAEMGPYAVGDTTTVVLFYPL